MPRRLYNWTAEDVVRFLKAHNFLLNYSRGSHFYYIGHCGGTLMQVCVSFHGSRTIKPRTLKGIIRQSGVPREEWFSGE